MSDVAMLTAPATDADVPAYWQGLGLPGIADVHVHFMPHNVLAKVWAYFDAVGPLVGRPWPITYRDSEAGRLATLAELGVRSFPSLVYAHKPGMSAWLNEWSLAWAAEHPQVVPTGTFFPEPGVLDYVTAALAAGVRIWKLHPQVGGWDPRSPLLDPVWELLSAAGTPIIGHVGSGPVPGEFTGPGPISEVLSRHPRMPLVVAHMGMPDIDAFLDLASDYERVMLDTTMAWVDFFPHVPTGDLTRIRSQGLAGKVLWGSDFPNIPHSYAAALGALVRLGLGDDWMRAVLWSNAASLGLTS